MSPWSFLKCWRQRKRFWLYNRRRLHQLARVVMGRSIGAWLVLLVFAVAGAACYAQTWTEGTNYFAVNPPLHTTVQPGKVEVLEVFSYACPACNAFQPVMKQLRASLPPNAQIAYLPASFRPDEDWSMFQRAFFTAQALGVVDKTHDAMFDAVWQTGELATFDQRTRRIKNPLPTIEDAARFYARTAGVKPETFLATAKSFGVESKMKIADSEIGMAQALSTPTIIVNGKYRLQAQTAGGLDQMVQLIKYLVARESGGGKPAAGK
jgi:protein dithiol oxidoreductase (disulfide-forming)